MYCEDSSADEIEHLRPKSLYPEVVFAWVNFLFACGRCNGPKNDRFKVISSRTGAHVEVTRRRGVPVAPPEPGEMMLIDPRREDPLDFMTLDLCSTFYFVPRSSTEPSVAARAEYTIEVLRLNHRDVLRGKRAEAYVIYWSLLRDYIALRDGGAPPAELDARISFLRGGNHFTVFREMQRQHRQIKDLRQLFDHASEALAW